MTPHSHIKTLTTRTKSQQLIEILKNDLLSGKHTVGDTFYSQNELADSYGISHITAREAIGALVQEGMLTRSQGKGTFVSKTRERIQESNLAALVMHAHGHLFGELAQHLIRVLQETGFHTLIQDVSVSTPQVEEELSKGLEKVMSADMGAFIIDGIGRFPFDKVYGHDEKPIIFIYRLETPLPFPNAFKVLHDFEAGGYMVIKHLLDLGHKKILFYTHPIQPEPYFLTHSLLKGMDRAFEERGLDNRKSLVIKTHGQVSSEKDLDALKKVLSGPHRTTGVFTHTDSMARDIFSVARELDLSIPGDLAVAGYFNTPWCEMFPVLLTSVSIEPEKIVDEVRDILLRMQSGEKITERCIMVKPKLVIRKSTGCKTNKEGADAMNKEHCIARSPRR